MKKYSLQKRASKFNQKSYEIDNMLILLFETNQFKRRFVWSVRMGKKYFKIVIENVKLGMREVRWENIVFFCVQVREGGGGTRVRRGS
jgi:hypothetical protein